MLPCGFRPQSIGFRQIGMTTQAQIIIDKTGHIIRCNDVWDRMMRSRRLRHLTESQITGKELRSLIPTSTWRQIADGIALSIMEQSRAIRLDYQSMESGECFLLEVGPEQSADADDSIKIEIEQVEGGTLCQDSEEIGLINMCSHCRRIRVDADWVEIIEAVQSLHLLCLDPPPPISHGMCPDCFSPSPGN